MNKKISTIWKDYINLIHTPLIYQNHKLNKIEMRFISNNCDKYQIMTLPQEKLLLKMEEDSLESCYWASKTVRKTQTQLQRYEARSCPEHILSFIRIGGGPGMGTELEKFARFKFKNLEKRLKGKEETGYDHVIKNGDTFVYVEQKSSGHWGENDYKWQHVEPKHKWTMLLLCGIDYTHVRFWGMNRATFQRLMEEKKITNQGNKAGDSSEGTWFNYSDVADSLTEILDENDLLSFAINC